MAGNMVHDQNAAAKHGKGDKMKTELLRKNELLRRGTGKRETIANELLSSTN